MKKSISIGKLQLLITILTLAILSACTNNNKDIEIDIIPIPKNMKFSDGVYPIDSTQISLGNSVTINPESEIDPEGYHLKVDKDGISIKASTASGYFYAKQTLMQLYRDGGIPYVEIEDEPRLQYRGLHLDVSRHFFDKEEIKKILNAMAFYKLNVLHLHLTDAGGWRLQIYKYPLLTELGAFRTESNWQEWWINGDDRKYVPEGTPGAYGGYYTKEDMREIIAYAKSKHIDILPEIEFPGHSEEVFFAYPELSCSGEQYGNSDFCIGNPDTFTFMEGILTEVIELFPYEYVHIGGDEAGKTAWKTCPKCQALMKKEGMEHIDELQSYMIHKADDFIRSKGRKLVGWDEILEGGLAPGATVMSWRGEAGGIHAARVGQDVIMTPGSHMYFDFYQADPRTEPMAIGGHTTIKKAYSYNPIPKDSLTDEQAKHIIGVQGNTWTEYMENNEHLEYMMFPRALAVAEIGWSPQELRSWESFKPRVNKHIPQLQAMGINTFTLSNELDVLVDVDTNSKKINLYFDAEKHPVEIRYTIDGSTPTASSNLYKDGVIIKDSARVRAGIFKNGELQGTPTAKELDYHKAIGKKVTYNNRLSNYMAGGMGALVDGYRGGLTYLDGLWQGYTDSLNCVIDMGEITDIKSVQLRFMQLAGPWVWMPGTVEFLISDNGVDYVSCGKQKTAIEKEYQELIFETYKFEGDWKGRYLNIKASEVQNGFIFTDEIIVW